MHTYANTATKHLDTYDNIARMTTNIWNSQKTRSPTNERSAEHS